MKRFRRPMTTASFFLHIYFILILHFSFFLNKSNRRMCATIKVASHPFDCPSCGSIVPKAGLTYRRRPALSFPSFPVTSRANFPRLSCFFGQLCLVFFFLIPCILSRIVTGLGYRVGLCLHNAQDRLFFKPNNPGCYFTIANAVEYKLSLSREVITQRGWVGFVLQFWKMLEMFIALLNGQLILDLGCAFFLFQQFNSLLSL